MQVAASVGYITAHAKVAASRPKTTIIAVITIMLSIGIYYAPSNKSMINLVHSFGFDLDQASLGLREGLLRRLNAAYPK